MRFIVDAQLPRKLTEVLRDKGHDAIHTLDLPLRNGTPDTIICDISVSERRTVITKDTDFLGSHLINGVPEHLILVRTGNIRNRMLLDLFRLHIHTMELLLEEHTLIELTAEELVAHKRR